MSETKNPAAGKRQGSVNVNSVGQIDFSEPNLLTFENQRSWPAMWLARRARIPLLTAILVAEANSFGGAQ